MARFHSLFRLLCILLLTALTLSSCGFDRDQQDQKLAKSCEAAIRSVLPSNHTIEAVKGAQLSFSPTLGNGKNFRLVTLSVSEKAEWHVSDKNYECAYIESLDLTGFGMKSDLYQVKINDQVLGRDDQGNVTGSMNDWLALQQVAKQALQE